MRFTALVLAALFLPLAWGWLVDWVMEKFAPTTVSESLSAAAYRSSNRGRDGDYQI